MKISLLVLLSILGLSSCAKKDDGGGLTVTMTPGGSYALSPSILTCAQISGIDTSTSPSLTGRRVILGKPVFTWTNTSRYLAIDQIVLVFNSPYLNNQVFAYENIDQNEVRGIIGGTTAPTSTNTTGWIDSYNVISKAAEGAPVVIKSKCEVRFGGISISDTAPSFRAQGQMKVFGRSIEYDSSFNVVSEQPIFTQVSVYFEYTKYQ